MIPLYNTSQIRELDRFAIESLGVPGPVLMENAAIGIIDTLDEKIDLRNSKIKFGIVCGKGNNGGDGYAIARHLSNLGHDIKLISLGNEKNLSEDCRLNFSILSKLSANRKNIKIKKFQSIKDIRFISDSHIVIDAVLGTGVTGDLKPPIADIIRYLNSLPVIRIAVDIPTGLSADTGYGNIIFNADFTITLGDYKRGLFVSDGSEYSGEIIRKEIGVGTDYLGKTKVQDYLIEPEDIFALIPVKRKSLNKYSAGKVLVIAGSGKYPGAAVLTSQSAFKSGAGAVILAFPESIRKLIQKNLPEVVFQTYESSENVLTKKAAITVKEKINWSDVIAVGPGLDRHDETIEAVKELLKIRKNKLIVIDADAIYALRNNVFKDYNLNNVLFTPHLGEFSTLIGIPVDKIKQDVLSYGKGFTLQTGCFLVLKGSPTIIFTPDGEALVNTTGNPGMAKFGTGDVLTGMIAAFTAQTKNLESGILLGVYLHSLSADILMDKLTEFGINAKDIMNNIPNAIEFIRKSFDQVS